METTGESLIGPFLVNHPESSPHHRDPRGEIKFPQQTTGYEAL